MPCSSRSEPGKLIGVGPGLCRLPRTTLLGRWVQTRAPRPLRWSSGLDFSWLAVRTYHAMSRDLPMREIKRRLSWVDFLSPLSDEGLNALQGRATFVRLQKGEVMVVGAEEHGEWMLIVVAGHLQVFETSLRSERELTLAVLGSGSTVNGTGVVARWTRELSLRALEPSVVCRLAQQDLQDLMRCNRRSGSGSRERWLPGRCSWRTGGPTWWRRRSQSALRA